MVNMLPTAADNGARLAAILPSGLAAIARGQGKDPRAVLAHASAPGSFDDLDVSLVPELRSFVLIVVDGLGHANLAARKGHAPTLTGLQQRRIETVAPSTTGAALTAITTGRLPGEHGLAGYRIRHPEFGLRATLSEWDGITDVRSWQRATPLFAQAREVGARPVVIGRPAHEEGGLTRAILSDADYLSGQRIDDRFAIASQTLRAAAAGPAQESTLIYLYVDELDRAAHEHGWESSEWVRRLEQLDAALADFLRALPGGVGVAVTADHGIIDVPAEQHVLLDSVPGLLDGVVEIGGEPRFRALYLAENGAEADPALIAEVRDRIAAAEGDRAWVFTRDEAITADVFGPVAPEVAPRLGDVFIAARKRVAYYVSADTPSARSLVGQHGSFSEDERGVPLALAGALAGTGFTALVTRVAALRGAALAG